MTPLGPVMADVGGYALTEEERAFLGHPLIGGVILFSRNYLNPEQLRALTADIKFIREPQLLIAVDHEGGRVQRFRTGFTAIPPMRLIGSAWDKDKTRAAQLARAVGLVIGHELAAHGLDFSFAPVLDIDFGTSAVIGDRSFSSNPEAVGDLAGEMIQGLASMGVASVGKHFPGHGFVSADSHVAIPRDERSYQEIDAHDLVPYRMVIPKGMAGIMPAHIIYAVVDRHPAGFSGLWIRDVLRQRLGFGGVVFSDDLTMEGAATAGGITDRAKSAFLAGCDMVLVCNAPKEARRLVKEVGSAAAAFPSRLAESMRARPEPRGKPAAQKEYRDALALLLEFAR